MSAPPRSARWLFWLELRGKGGWAAVEVPAAVWRRVRERMVWGPRPDPYENEDDPEEARSTTSA